MIVAAALALSATGLRAQDAPATRADGRHAVAAKVVGPTASQRHKTIDLPRLRPAAQKGLTLRTPAAIPAIKNVRPDENRRPNVKAPMRVDGNFVFPELCGAVYSSSGIQDYLKQQGMYAINADGTTTYLYYGPVATGGGVEIDGLYYATEATRSAWTGEVDVYTYIYDTEAQSSLSSYQSQVTAAAVGGIAKDPTTGKYYGITYNADATGLQLSEMRFSSEGITSTEIAALAGEWTALICDNEGQLYAIEIESQEEGWSTTITGSFLSKIDKTTGAVTRIGSTGELPYYASSALYNPQDGIAYWNVCPMSETSKLVTIDLATGATTDLVTLVDNDQILGMYLVPPDAAPEAPAAATNISLSFPEGAMTGTVEFDAPSKLFSGEDASGDLTYTVTADGTTIGEGSTTFGGHVSLTATFTEPGVREFVVTTANAAGSSPKAKVQQFIGFGKPRIPEVALVRNDLMIDLLWYCDLTSSVDGGFLNPNDVTYRVTRYPDETVVADNLTVCNFSETLPEPESLQTVYYTVEAVNHGIASYPARSNSETIGNIVPPYLADFESSDSLDPFTIIDANEDGREWSYMSGEARMNWNSSLAMDDWLITPPIKLQGGKAYQISFLARSYSDYSSYIERIEAKWGTAPTVEGMTQQLVAPTEVSTPTNYEDPQSVAMTLSGIIMPEADGVYYIGLHGISDPDRYYLYVDNLSVAEAPEHPVPAGVTDLTVTPAADGSLQAVISFKAPTTDIADGALESLSKIEIKRGNEVIHTVENPAPGAEVTFTDELTSAGNYIYSVKPWNETGAGVELTVSAFVGFDKPEAPASVEIVETDTEGEVHLYWAAVTADINGKRFADGDVAYKISAFDGSDWVSLIDGITATDYTLVAVPEGEQSYVQFAVFAYNESGENGIACEMISVGTPYSGYSESFSDGSLTYSTAVGYTANEATWSLVTDSQVSVPNAEDGDNGFAIMTGQTIGACSSLLTGKISLAGIENPGVSLFAFNYLDDDGANVNTNEVHIYVATTEAPNEWTELAGAALNTLTDKEEWCKINASLSAYADKVIYLRIEGVVKMFTNVVIDNIQVGTLRADDIAVTGISAPKEVKAGSDYQVTVSLSNEGTSVSPELEVKLMSGEEAVGVKTLAPLMSGARTGVVFTVPMSAAATGSTSLHALVERLDEVSDNNVSETVEVMPHHTLYPSATDLTGEATDGGVVLTWGAPDLSGAIAEEVTESFETTDNFSHTVDGWTLIDRDNSPAGGLSGVTIPGIASGDPSGFFVLEGNNGDFNSTFTANSGVRSLVSLYRSDGLTSDDWAISPELTGEAQTLSLYARSYSPYFPEKFEIL